MAKEAKGTFAWEVKVFLGYSIFHYMNYFIPRCMLMFKVGKVSPELLCLED